MGFYVNPPNQSKEQFLAEKGTRVDLLSLRFDDIPKGTLPVVLVDNGFFTAAGIGYSASEVKAFCEPGDRRPKQAFLVRVEDLVKVADSEFQQYAKKEGLWDGIV
ncbi:MAG: hypothetical protein WCT26_03415 [Candidatus Buchananbacteria bacterium]